MTDLQRRQKQLGTLLCMAGLFLILFLLCRLYPLVGDDWYREALGASIHSPWDLIREVASRWSTYNSRILPNLLAYASGSRPLLREVLQTSLTLALITLLAHVTKTDGWRGLLLWTAAVMALPLDIFAQIHSWAAGFFVFVPPVVMLFGCLLLVRPVLYGEKLKEAPVRWTALFILGFLQALSAEHSTVYAILAAMVLLVWYKLEQKKWSQSLLAMLLGCVLGAALLFASPAYRLIGSGDNYYSTGLTGGLAGLMGTARRNLPVVIRYTVSDCPVVYWSLTALTILLGLKRHGLVHRLLAAALALSCLCLACGGGRFLPYIAACVWALLLTLALILWMPDRVSRNRTLFLLLSAPVAAGPLLFVNPIGSRCLIASYIMLLAAAGSVLKVLGPDRLPSVITGLVPAVLALAVLVVCFSAFIPIHKTELERTRLLEEAVSTGATEVTIPAYGHNRWLLDADSAFKLGQYYYMDTPGDLTINFEPAD